MSTPVSETSLKLLRKLITAVTGIKEDTTMFEKLEKLSVSEVEKSDSMSFKNREEMDKIMESLGDKFLLHGFKPQAEDLLSLYKKFMDEVSTFYDASHKRSIIRFIIAMAESPTNNFFKYQLCKRNNKETQINWSEYLQEGIPKWLPPLDGSDTEWSDDSDITFDIESESKINDSECCFQLIEENEKEEIKTAYEIYCESRQNVLSEVQHTWFISENIQHKPISDDREANIAFCWDDYINKVTGGLIPEIGSNIISEYKVLREVIWQFYEPTNSFCFEFFGNRLIAKGGVTIASIREYCFETVIGKFLPYVEMLQSLREFQCSVNRFDFDNIDSPINMPPDTYRSYACALKDILEPVFDSFRDIEAEIQHQEKISTLITLFQRLRPVFKTIEVVKKIHNKVIIDFALNSSSLCASTLLARLNASLLHCSSKLEQDIMVTMYLESLKKYMTTIESWLLKDVLQDYTEEFLIAEGENQNERAVDFHVKELDDFANSDKVINFFCTEVLQIGRNVHLLRLLGKSHLVNAIPEMGISEKSLHEDFIDDVLEEVALYFKIPSSGLEQNEEEEQGNFRNNDNTSVKFRYPISRDCTAPTEFDRLENLVDTSDGFLVAAFQRYFTENVEPPSVPKESVYHRVTKTTKSLCPIQQILQNVLFKLLKERFSVSGILAKNLLIAEYKLEEYFKFLQHTFLFQDELIFPFYRKYLEQINSTFEMNEIWLTTQLQDILMDIYPDFFENCRIELKENWKQCKDALKFCTLLKIRMVIQWPASLIIQSGHLGMYADIFRFILEIKWALFTLTHLSFSDLEPRSKPAEKPSRLTQKIIAKLKIFRFGLVNDFSSVQHYILGYIYNKHDSKFKQDLKDSYDFESVFRSHDNFIRNLYKDCIAFRDYQTGNHVFYLLLFLVRKLNTMWTNVSSVNDLELDKYANLQKECHSAIDSIVNQIQFGGVDV